MSNLTNCIGVKSRSTLLKVRLKLVRIYTNTIPVETPTFQTVATLASLPDTKKPYSLTVKVLYKSEKTEQASQHTTFRTWRAGFSMSRISYTAFRAVSGGPGILFLPGQIEEVEGSRFRAEGQVTGKQQVCSIRCVVPAIPDKMKYIHDWTAFTPRHFIENDQTDSH